VNAHVVPVAVRVVDPHDSAAFGRDDPAPSRGHRCRGDPASASSRIAPNTARIRPV